MARWWILLAFLAHASNADPLRIGITADYPPFVFRDQAGRLSGLDVDILTEICQRGGYDCEWVNLPLNQMLDAISSGRVDVAAGGIGNTAERDRIVDFTCPYAVFETYTGVFLSPKSDVDLKSVKIAVTDATLYEKVLRTAGYRAEPYPSDAEAIAATLAGKAGAYFGSYDASMAVPGTAERMQQVATLDMPPGGAAFVIAEDAVALEKTLNDLLAGLSSEGRIAALQKSWLALSKVTSSPSAAEPDVVMTRRPHRFLCFSRMVT